MPRRPVEDEDDDEDDLADPVVALLAALVVMMSCPDCKGTGEVRGVVGASRCKCRDFGHRTALQALSEEGLLES